MRYTKEKGAVKNLFFSKSLFSFPIFFVSLLSFVMTVLLTPLNLAHGEEAPKLPHIDWSFNGPFGKYDKNALRRGFKIYREVCSTCHAMSLLHYRDLGDEGGPAFSAAEVAAIASSYQVQDGPDAEGNMFQRPGKPKDQFVSPFANDEAARATLGGALPPDQSLLVKARDGGPNYIYAILTGYANPPSSEDPKAHVGAFWNNYFTAGNGWIHMPPPLSNGLVKFDDGTPSTVDQMAKDVTQFLAWASDPKLESRHKIGFSVMIYLIILAVLLYFTTRKLWSKYH